MTTLGNLTVYSTTYTPTEIDATINEISGSIAVVDNKIAKEKLTIFDGKYVHKTTGEEKTDNAYCVTDFIDATHQIMFKTTLQNNTPGVVFYDCLKQYISGDSYYTQSGTYVIPDIPANAAYIRVSCIKAYKDDLRVISIIDPSAVNSKMSVSKKTECLVNGGTYDTTSEIQFSKGYFLTTSTNPYVARNTGPTMLSEMIRLYKGQTIEVTTTGKNLTQLAKWASDAITDPEELATQGSAYRALSRISYSTEDTPFTTRYTALQDVEFLMISMVSYDTTRKTANPFKITLTIPPEDSFEKIKTSNLNCFANKGALLGNMVCIGDSLTIGAYYMTATTAQIARDSWPNLLAKMTNQQVNIIAQGGWTSRDAWLSGCVDFDFSHIDTAFIWLGTNGGINDDLDSDVLAFDDFNDYAQSNVGYYCRIMSKAMQDNPNIRFILGTVFAPTHTAITNSVINKIAVCERYAQNVLGVVDFSDGSVYKGSYDNIIHVNGNSTHFGRIGNFMIANKWLNSFENIFLKDPTKLEVFTAR